MKTITNKLSSKISRKASSSIWPPFFPTQSHNFIVAVANKRCSNVTIAPPMVLISSYRLSNSVERILPLTQHQAEKSKGDKSGDRRGHVKMLSDIFKIHERSEKSFSCKISSGTFFNILGIPLTRRGSSSHIDQYAIKALFPVNKCIRVTYKFRSVFILF